MQNFNTSDFQETGIYEIKNILNSKRYIGSTTMSFQKRLNHHRSLLRAGNHKNNYLQNSWDKYGEDNFVFSILEVVDKCCTLTVEQVYIDKEKPEYNINPLASGTPNLSKETIDKRTKTFTLFMEEAMSYYYKVRDKEITIEDVPEKYLKTVVSRVENIVWNKGLTKNDMDYSYLKVPKTISEALKQAQKNTSERQRNIAPFIYVYDSLNVLLGDWRCSKDLEEWSLTDENNLPINSRFKKERMGVSLKFLSSGNIMKVVDSNKTYKGLYFTTLKK